MTLKESVIGKDSPSPPPAPDYRGAAIETSAGNAEAARIVGEKNLELARAAASANRINQYTPYGYQEYSQIGDNPDRWRSDISLVPTVQNTLNKQMDLSNQMADLTQAQVPRVQNQYSQPMDLSGVPQIADRAYQAFTSRLDPRFQQEENQLRTRLANQGMVAGGDAYDKEMRNFGQTKNDAYQQANLGAISTMPQTYQLANSAYDKPLNIMNAIRSGAQIQNPTFTPPGMQQATSMPGYQGPNYLGAAQAQYGGGLDAYNAQIGQQNAMTSGLFGLGAAALGSPWGGGFGSFMGGG